MDLKYEIEIDEPAQFIFDIKIEFHIEDNPFIIRIKDVLGGCEWKNYRDVDTDLAIDISNWSDDILGFKRDPFRLDVIPVNSIYYNLEVLRSRTLIDEEVDYIALNKLRSTIGEGEDKDLELYKILKNMLEVGFTFLEQYIEKKRVEEQFNKKEA